MIPNLIVKRFLLSLCFIFTSLLVYSQQGIGTNQPDPSSVLEVSSTDKGFLIPRMTTAQRNAINAPALGLLVFNTDVLCVEINTSSVTTAPLWECLGAGQQIINSLACYAATVSGSIFTGKAANAEITIPYGGGDASAYAGGTVVSSGQALGATGLTATLQAGTLNTGTGALTYLIEGTMATSGNAYFDISFGAQHCVLAIPVNDSTSGGSAVVDAWDCSGAATGTLVMGETPDRVTQTIYADVSQAGTYKIEALSNGILFKAEGTFDGTGTNKEVVLYASGTPLASGTTSFTLNTTPNCSFERVVYHQSSGGTAMVNAWDCSGAATGSLTIDTTVSGVTQQVTADVAAIGTYDITTTANGITFTASGTFAGTGDQIVTLTATGTPTAMGTHTFALSTTPNCSFERTTVADPSSGGSAVVDAWDCTGTATGSSTVGVSAAGNTKIITATVNTVGSYSVSATANGVTYTAAGTFAATGAQDITLTATGTPIAGGTATYTLDTTPGCSFNIETLDESSGGSAAVSSWDCSGTSTGTPTIGIAVSDVTQQVTANVATEGTYDITTTANGITFTASGTFAGTGAQVITLTATGTPTAIGTHSFTLSTTPNCSFDFETISALAVSCNTATASGTLYKDLVVGGAAGDFTYTLDIGNTTSEAVTANFATTDLTLGGANAGLSVDSVSPAGAVSIAANSTQTVVYTLGGTPTATGTLNLDWAANNLSCATSTATVLLGTASFTLPVVFEIDTGDVSLVDNGANQVVVSVPYTNAIGAYAAFTGTGVLADTTSDTNNMHISYPAGSFDASGSGSISVTIVVEDDGSYVVAEPATGTATIVTLPFFYNGNTPTEGDIILNAIANLGLPAGMAIIDADQNKFVVSIYDTDYNPAPNPLPAATLSFFGDGGTDPTVDVQGVIGTLGSGDEITVTLTTSSTGGVAYPAFSQTISIPSSLIEGGGAPIDLTMSYPGGTTTVGAGTITATIAAASTLNVKQLDLYGAGFNDPIIGYPLAAFSLSTDDSGGAGTVGVRIMSGILDREFGDGAHDFIYLPVVSTRTGETWLNNNLGAYYADVNHASFNLAQQATTSTDHLAYGSLYQWGRYSDGHELIRWSSGTAGSGVNGVTNVKDATPDHGDFITDDSYPLEWHTGTINKAFWQGASAVNNPCPNGYRIPTETELVDESFNSTSGALNSPLKLPIAGQRSAKDALIYTTNSYGQYWSSSFYNNGTSPRRLVFDSRSGSASVGGTDTAWGFSVRCIKD